ncbi:phosphomannomutase/phosphoglucomutase [Salix suchowensis]|nr:phosphomannomutase/phosphoglucomutase [Salix suchowensis]
MAATVLNVIVAKNRQLGTNEYYSYQTGRDCCSAAAAPYNHHRNLLPFHGGKTLLAWRSGISSMHLPKYQTAFVKRPSIYYCNAALSTTAVPYIDKVDFMKLQNGSDIRGVAVPGVEGEPVTLTEPVTEAIAAAFSAWLSEKKKVDASKPLKVSVGHDSRISAQVLQDAVSRGIASAGLDVVQYGLASTPAMFNSTLTEDEAFLCPVDGAIMITASHLPYNRNGFKFFTNAGGLGKADIKNILERAVDIYNSFTDEGLMKSKREASESLKRVDYMTVYTSDLVKAVRKAAGNIEKPLEGFHVVVDAGNGAGGFFAEKVLQPLGANTSGSQFLEPDGMFPNHIPNPEDKTAMKAITQAVLENKADLGIIFDTDVDRSAAVDSTGREFNRNRLIALMSAIVLEEHPGTTIVTDSVTSDGLTMFIENKLGGKHHRFKRGYKNVIDEAVRLNSVGEESHLAIETSGHGALKENHWLDDGAYLMVKVLNKLASARTAGIAGGSKVLTDLVEGLQEPRVAVELRLKIDQNHPDLKGGSFREYGEAVLKLLENHVESDPKLQKAPVNYEGVRVSGFGGWFLLRLSLHDPVLPLNFEAPSHEDAVKLGLAVASAVREFPALDTSALDKFVQTS